jgi:hypothetical protein
MALWYTKHTTRQSQWARGDVPDAEEEVPSVTAGLRGGTGAEPGNLSPCDGVEDPDSDGAGRYREVFQQLEQNAEGNRDEQRSVTNV